MRIWPALVVLLLAGCTTRSVETSTSVATSKAPTNATATNSSSNVTQAPPPPPLQPYSTKQSHSYQTAPESQRFVVPDRAAPARITLRIAPLAGACVSTDASVELRAPSGALVASLAVGAAPPSTSDACPPAKVLDRVPLDAGAWTVKFAGSGAGVGTVDVAPAGGI